MKTLSVLIVEDSDLFRVALTNVLSRTQALKPFLCSSSSFLEQMEKTHRDAVLMDAVTWNGGLQTLVAAVGQASPLSPVILLGREDRPGRYVEAIRAGAAGFVPHTASVRLLLKAVRTVAEGRVWFEKRLLRGILEETRLPDGELRQVHLNEKERSILRLLACGKTNKEIGVQLGFTERTIKGHVSDMFRKTGASNRSSLTSFAILHGLTPWAHLQGP